MQQLRLRCLITCVCNVFYRTVSYRIVSCGLSPLILSPFSPLPPYSSLRRYNVTFSAQYRNMSQSASATALLGTPYATYTVEAGIAAKMVCSISYRIVSYCVVSYHVVIGCNYGIISYCEAHPLTTLHFDIILYNTIRYGTIQYTTIR